MDFSINSRRVMEFRVERMRGDRGLGLHRLGLALEFSRRGPSDENDTAVLVDLSGALHVQSQAGGPHHYLGRLRPSDGSVLIEAKRLTFSPHQQNLELELDGRRLNALEDMRLGRGLNFQMQFWGLIQRGSEHHTVHSSGQHVVNQGTWLELLQEMGYGRFLLLEVPVPDSETHPNLTKAIEHLTRAQAYLNEGRYRDAVGSCRDVLEALSLELGDGPLQNSVSQTLFANSREMDKAARYSVLRQALKLVTHPARHVDEVSVQIAWERNDAVNVLAMVTAALRRFG